MSQLTSDEVLKLARLSRLNLTDEEVNLFLQEINSILDYVKKLQSIETTDLEPTYQVNGLFSVMRKDEIIDYGATKSELLINAPAIEKGHFKVRRVLE
jgi:aspartyl-tRNA(Asn)/glutamyl-tRNA(Gln) amidotransferase subunit C